ncbi:MAG: permease [Thermodesulfobacteriota bacterium]|nr:permease [Thermodesulfobacteriota bacterium]
MKEEWKKLTVFIIVFAIAYCIPLGNAKVKEGIFEAFRLLQWYAREHTLTCVVPALFIAGAITTFLSHASVMRYLGPKANKMLAYSVASVSGSVLAVCSCSVLPIFAGIYRLGAGLGPASAFLYSGPAINILAILLSAKVLGFDIGLARALGAIVFAFIIGLLMAMAFRKEEKIKADTSPFIPEQLKDGRPLWKTALFFACMVLFLVFSDWYNPGTALVTLKDGRQIKVHVRYETRDSVTLQLFTETGEAKNEVKTYDRSEILKIEPEPSLTLSIYHIRWHLAGLMLLAVIIMVLSWFTRDEVNQWMQATWDFAKLLVPLLYGGVFVVGFLTVFIPEEFVASMVGNNSLFSNFFASIVGALFYFATLTEIPITQVLMKLGMAKGPALALLLAGPAVSLPNLLVIRSIMGTKKAGIFTFLVIIMATITGIIFGYIVT